MEVKNSMNNDSIFLKKELYGLIKLLDKSKIFNYINKLSTIITIVISFNFLYQFKTNNNLFFLEINTLLLLFFIFNMILLISNEMEKDCIRKLTTRSVFLIKEIIKDDVLIKNFVTEKEKNNLINFIKNRKSFFEVTTEKQITIKELEKFLEIQEENK